MDARALSWIHLVPADAGICPAGAPDELLGLLGTRLDRSGAVWLGWERSRDDLPPLQHFRVVALVRPRGITSAWLQAQGFAHIQPFAIMPGCADARWFFSLQSRRAAMRAWELYTPFRGPARLQKLIASALTRGGLIRHMGDRMILAQRDCPPLEQMLTRMLNAGQLCISIASGTPGPHRKLTLQLATRTGAVLAYAKYADRPETGAIVRREAGFRDYIKQLGLKQVIAPEILYHGAIDGAYVMVSAPAAGRMLATRLMLTGRHIDALRELGRHTGTIGTRRLLDSLMQRIAAQARRIGRAWSDRLAQAVALACTVPDLATLPTVLSHGDFAPWNLRDDHRSGRLVLFDWEQGKTDQFPLWDAFHFLTQIEALVLRRPVRESIAGTLATIIDSPLAHDLHLGAAQVRALYTIYLADASVRWFEEQPATSGPMAPEDADQMMRGRLLDAQLAASAVLR